MISCDMLMKQIQKVERVQFSVTSFFENAHDYLYKDYPYTEPMDGDATVDDLINARIKPAFESKVHIAD